MALSLSMLRRAGVAAATKRAAPAASAANPGHSPSAVGLNMPLSETDPQVAKIIRHEEKRQLECVNLIPSENFTSRAVLDALGSVMQNKYSEGYPGARYYGGNEFIDQSEALCEQRALEVYDLDPEKWGVNVQVYSGAPANFAVYTANVPIHGRIMGLELAHGGHLSHGFSVFGKDPKTHLGTKKKVSMISKFWETMTYRLDESTGLIDYDKMQLLARAFRPELIVSGATAYSRLVDCSKFRSVCDEIGAVSHYDMAHISGLVAGKAVPSPFEWSDIVTSTTHKSLRGPRGSMIFYRKGAKLDIMGNGGDSASSSAPQQAADKKTGKVAQYDFERKIKETVFPGLQGGPHNHSITALAVALKQAKTPEFADYQQRVLDNSLEFCQALQQKGYSIVSGGTENHMFVADVKGTKSGFSGAKAERVCELANIVGNKNTVPTDRSPMNPSGLRIGTVAMTSRGFGKAEFRQVADFMDRAIELGVKIEADALAASGKKALKLVDFNAAAVDSAELKALREEVAEFCRGYEMIGLP